MTQRTWLLVCCVLVLVSLVLGVGIGMLLPRVAHLTRQVTDAQPSVKATSPGVLVEELTPTEEMFSLAGEKGVAFKATGGDVEFWIERDAEGKTESFGRELIAGTGQEPAGPQQSVEIYFVWARGEPDEAGQEVWKLGRRRDLVAAGNSQGGVSVPLAQLSIDRSREERQSSLVSDSLTVQAWQEKGTAGGSTGVSVASTIPRPLPTDREVCLKKIEERRKKDEKAEHHVLRVMCRVMADRGSADRDAAATKP